MPAHSSTNRLIALFSKEVIPDLVPADDPAMKEEEARIENLGAVRRPPRSEKSSTICNNFLRKVCRRGRFCRFAHPIAHTWELQPDCKDFLNGKCLKSRHACKYRHITRAEHEWEKSQWNYES